jgi:adenylate cyclase
MTATRRLAAILAADVAGYSRLMGADEEGTLERLKALRRELVDPKIAEHHGRLVKTTGDGLLVEFGSVIDALRCATEIQTGMAERTTVSPADRQIEFRIGIHQGDVVVEDGDIFGDGVNVAARLEALAEPGGICVSARVQEDAAGRLDLTFEDMGEQTLKNIARPVRAYRVVTAAGAPPTRVISGPPLPDKPSIAVLPFANLSGDPEQEYFADGMVEEIITALSRVRWLFVIARNSSFTYKGQAVDVKQVGRELGVRYVLEGSVRKAGGRVRITAQLIEAAPGTHLWADRFDGSLDNIFDLQDQVAMSVAGAIEPTLRAAEIRRSSKRAVQDSAAYDLYLQALPDWASFEIDRIQRALGLLERANERDPEYGPALAAAAHCHHQLSQVAPDAGEPHRSMGVDLARQALRAAPEDPEVLGIAAYVLGRLGNDLDVSLALVDRALVLNPSFALGWYWSGLLRSFVGWSDIALDHFEKYLRLSPLDRYAPHPAGIGSALFFLGRFDEAAASLLEALERVPSHVMAHRFLASCYAHMGRFAEAREVVDRLRAITPMVMPNYTPYRDPERREFFLSGLRLAAGERA